MDNVLRRSAALVAVALLAVTGCASRQPADVAIRYELTGTVAAVPGCPGPIRLDTPCPPRAVPGAHVDADVDGSVAAATTTDRNGHFEMRLPPGPYVVIVVTNGGFHASATRSVSLVANTDITVRVDSGMR